MNACHQIRSDFADDFAPGILCWTRMQAEAGQQLESIVQRKELERAAGGGIFFWGVGNAPSTMIRSLSRMGTPVPVVFSVMKGRAKTIDAFPNAVVAWNGYVDSAGVEREVPPHILVTSRRDSAAGEKRVHYALVCRSQSSLVLRSGRPFNHRHYKNVGPTGGIIGASQVTALIEPIQAAAGFGSAEYEECLCAELTGSYWVKLTRPSPVPWTILSTDFRDPSSYKSAVAAVRVPFGDRLPATGSLL